MQVDWSSSGMLNQWTVCQHKVLNNWNCLTKFPTSDKSSNVLTMKQLTTSRSSWNWISASRFLSRVQRYSCEGNFINFDPNLSLFECSENIQCYFFNDGKSENIKRYSFNDWNLRVSLFVTNIPWLADQYNWLKFSCEGLFLANFSLFLQSIH